MPDVVSAVFADSFYFLARLNRDDAAHEQAVRLGTQEWRPLVTTGWVLTEGGDTMSSPVNRLAFLRLFEALQSSPDAKIIPATAELFDRGVQLYAERPDKEWSLTDCISFVVMTDGRTDHGRFDWRPSLRASRI
ncbi:MAG: type II toxin-antitoxin system VapC family toxin [Verrucomicrobia bacterium]|nr:type II toxin-antitoxin system VapC family toxin [Verrucomicrobiota bacterium]